MAVSNKMNYTKTQTNKPTVKLITLSDLQRRAWLARMNRVFLTFLTITYRLNELYYVVLETNLVNSTSDTFFCMFIDFVIIIALWANHSIFRATF